ncbi:alpha/beta hydrolase [Pseudahrensia aquimaris]|uniref:Alpha/beta hydrolase n=1 Tax=Pseudahrensia aquimaris TaxID=744461 RepID=A0ABW3FF18_9HYPH
MRLFIAFAITLIASQAVFAFELKPYKDKLFAYPPVLETSDGGDFLRVAYDKQRDIYDRDSVPLRRVKDQYITPGLSFSRRVRSYDSPNGTQKYFTIGKRRNARVTVIYLYGKGGNRRQGVNDRTFGGNFNRLQVLMRDNDGVLVTPDYTDFKKRGTADIASLINEYRRRSPKTFLIVACGSMGGGVCWRLANSPATSNKIDGMFLLGSHWSNDFLDSLVVRERGKEIPLYFGHGSLDTVFQPRTQLDFFRRIKSINPGYPARFVMFETGKHGTPIRMVDWRREINWMLSAK